EAGNLFFADTVNNRIRMVDARKGIITTVAGDGNSVFRGDGGPATSATLSGPKGVILDGTGNLFIADTGNNRIRRVDARTGIITTIAGDGTVGFQGDNGLAIRAGLNFRRGLAVDGEGNLSIADTVNNEIRRVDAKTGLIKTG